MALTCNFPAPDISRQPVSKLVGNFGLRPLNTGYWAGACAVQRLCNYSPRKMDERRLIMKVTNTKKALKTAAAAAGVAAVLVLPTGCASSAAGSGGLVGGGAAGGGCVVSALGICV